LEIINIWTKVIDDQKSRLENNEGSKKEEDDTNKKKVLP